MYDIAIVGSGPAGSTLARLLAQDLKNNYKVALLDRRNLKKETDPKHRKACGGLLAPDAQRMLGKLGLSLPSSIMEDPQFFKVRTIDFDNNLERYYQRFYYNLDREKFDRYLFSLIPNSVDTYNGVLVNAICAQKDHWEIHFGDKASSPLSSPLKAKFLVAADGANSFTRQRIMPENHKKPKSYISIQKWYHASQTLPYYTGIFDQEITDYYSWTIQKKNHIILGTALPIETIKFKQHNRSHQKFELLTEKISQHLSLPFDKPVMTEGAFINRTTSLDQLLFGTQIQVGHNCTLPAAFLGEAAGATSPTSAEGFSYAMDTALKLYEAFQTGFKGAESRYNVACNSIRKNIFLKHLKSPGMYDVTLRKYVMKSGITAIKNGLDTRTSKRIYS